MRSRGRHRRLARFLPPIVALCVSFTTPLDGARAQAVDAEAGRRIYSEGVLPSGEPVRATVRDDVPLTGAQGACGSCHRRSGLGAVESGTIALPVTGDILFRPVWRGRPEMEMARTTGLNARPAYTDTSLIDAIVKGIGANGRTLDPTMPRYALSRADAQALVAYLKTLSSAPSPGADGKTIRFATIVAGDVPPERRKAFLDVIETFTREKNAGTRYEDRRRTRPPMDMEFEYIRYRDWVVDVWTLTGPPDTWRAQLDGLYRKQPVFAVLSGVAEGPWTPIHEFCEATRLPCVFPATDLPAVVAGDFYTVYFTRGMTLEGEVLASHLSVTNVTGTGGAPARGPVVQVSRARRPGATAAQALTRELTKRGLPVPTDITLDAVPAGVSASPLPWQRLGVEHAGATLVLWLEPGDLAGLDALAAAPLGPAQVYLSSSLAPAASALVPAALRGRARLVHPYEKPEAFDRRVQRTRTWLRSRKIASAQDERTQADAFFAVSIVNEALMHNYNFFVREYLVEQFESMASAMVVTSWYPRLTLGPGQRFGSRGAYIVALGEQQESAATTVSDWIVP